MKKQSKKTAEQQTRDVIQAAEVQITEERNRKGQTVDVTKAVDAMTAGEAKTFAQEVRAHGPVYRGRGILPGWMIAMTTREGTPVSRVYKVFGSIKARALALTLCRQHRLPLTFAEVNG